MWTLVKMLFNLTLFIYTGVQGISALVHHLDAGWQAGFVFCSTGTWLFGKSERGLLLQVFYPQAEREAQNGENLREMK